MMDQECPIDAVEEALQLAAQIEVRSIPLDFDAGDRRWRETLTIIVRQFSNHAALLDELDDVMADARAELAEDCDRMNAGSGEDPCAGCSKRGLAEHWLWEAALDASERAYQRWLARDALRRAAEQET